MPAIRAPEAVTGSFRDLSDAVDVDGITNERHVPLCAVVVPSDLDALVAELGIPDA